MEDQFVHLGLMSSLKRIDLFLRILLIPLVDQSILNVLTLFGQLVLIAYLGRHDLPKIRALVLF